MHISDILSKKPRRSLVSVRPNKSVDAFPGLFDDHGISSVLVIDAHGHLLGIVTDRLYLSAMAKTGRRFRDLTAADIMQSPAPACTAGDAVTEAMRRMTVDRIQHLVVLEGDEIAGIVSIGDLVKARLSEIEMESRVLRDIALVHMSAV